MNMNHIYFVSGIDTDAGKSYCTAWLARQLAGEGHRVITQKFIQTGNVGHSEDIDLHRRIMGTGYLPEDREGLTMPEIFSYPCSPHLAARIDDVPSISTRLNGLRSSWPAATTGCWWKGPAV